MNPNFIASIRSSSSWSRFLRFYGERASKELENIPSLTLVHGGKCLTPHIRLLAHGPDGHVRVLWLERDHIVASLQRFLVTLVVHGNALFGSLQLDLLLCLFDLIQDHPAGIPSIPLIFLFLVDLPDLVHIFHLVVQHVVKVGFTPK